MRLSAFLITLLLSGSAFAQAGVLSSIGHEGIINLRSNINSLIYQYGYPGMSEGEFNAPDCLALLTNGDSNAYGLELFQKLAAEIVVEDGPGILFDTDRGVTVLSPQITEDSLQYKITDLGSYVTGIRVSTKSGKTLNQVVRKILGTNSQNFVGLQLLRGCQH